MSRLCVPLLSSREEEVRQLIAQGLSDRDIAERLGLSVHTVKKHGQHIRRKLNVANRTQLAMTTKRKGKV